MRHISRTHRVNLEWLLERINLNLGIQIKYVNTSQQIADILTKGSFSCERWTQLRQLVTVMTPHMHSCSHSLVFSSVQKVKMSTRLPELVTEGAIAKQRPVRNCCTYSHHILSSSSRSLNPMQNLVETDSWRDANRVDSQKHVQKTYHEEEDILVLPGTEKLVALKHERVTGSDVELQTVR